MKTLLSCFALSVWLCATVVGQQADPIAALQLPDTSHVSRASNQRPWLVVVLPANYQSDAQSLELLAAIRTAPQESPLRRWLQQSHVVVKPISDPITKERHGTIVRAQELPAVFLQRPDGGVLYKATRSNLPTDHYTLGRELDYYAALDPAKSGKNSQLLDSRDFAGALEWVNQCPDGSCPDGNCPWQPTPPPDASPFDIPDSAPAAAIPWPMIALLFGLVVITCILFCGMIAGAFFFTLRKSQ